MMQEIIGKISKDKDYLRSFMRNIILFNDNDIGV